MLPEANIHRQERKYPMIKVLQGCHLKLSLSGIDTSVQVTGSSLAGEWDANSDGKNWFLPEPALSAPGLLKNQVL